MLGTRRWVFLASLAVATASQAQTTADINSGLQFNFTPPGAKSLALGGAFSGVADDATAVYANPAGLTSLSRPEASLEGRSSRYTNVFPSGGGEGRIPSTTSALAFGSVVIPVQDFSFAAYYHNAADFHPRIDAAPFTSPEGVIVPRRVGSLDLKLRSAGVAAAYHVADSLSLGLAVTNFDYSVQSCTQVSSPTGRADCVTRPVGSSATQEFHGQENRWGATVGLRWQAGDWSAGLVYRKLPQLTVQTTLTDADKNHTQYIRPGHFKVPDVLSAGAGFHPLQAVLISFEYDRVRYSQLAEGLVKMAASGAAPIAGSGSTQSDPRNFSIPDGNEFHLGGEYRVVIAAERALFVRLGVWREADHTLRYEGSDSALRARFGNDADRKDPTHGAGGLGLVLGKRFQVDAGVDYSPRLTSFALSSVVRF